MDVETGLHVPVISKTRSRLTRMCPHIGTLHRITKPNRHAALDVSDHGLTVCLSLTIIPLYNVPYLIVNLHVHRRGNLTFGHDTRINGAVQSHA